DRCRAGAAQLPAHPAPRPRAHGSSGEGGRQVNPLVGLLLLTTPTNPGPPRLPAGERPPIIREIGFDQRLGERVPLDAALRDEAGRTVRLGDYFGRKPVVLNLVYFDCPMLCTVSLNGLLSALDLVSFTPGQEFELITISFDPRETPPLAAAKKKAYLARYRRPSAGAGWHSLTGRYSARILGVVRVLGVLTVLALGGFIVTMRRRERAG